ncbi:MAG: hypothetical protein BWY88_00791 [Synergistetes bacterium ADurb.Bin520]|nr:MAG: hypothetical protein BWY88_00791 [Synergistetes bacterium ADurb.Bin520]
MGTSERSFPGTSWGGRRETVAGRSSAAGSWRWYTRGAGKTPKMRPGPSGSCPPPPEAPGSGEKSSWCGPTCYRAEGRTPRPGGRRIGPPGSWKGLGSGRGSCGPWRWPSGLPRAWGIGTAAGSGWIASRRWSGPRPATTARVWGPWKRASGPTTGEMCPGRWPSGSGLFLWEKIWTTPKSGGWRRTTTPGGGICWGASTRPKSGLTGPSTRPKGPPGWSLWCG